MYVLQCGFFRRKEREELQRLIRESVAHLDEYGFNGDDWEAEPVSPTRVPLWQRQDSHHSHHNERPIPANSFRAAVPLDDSFEPVVFEESPWVIRRGIPQNHTNRPAQSPSYPERQVVNGGHRTSAHAPWTYGLLPGANNISNPSYNGHPNVYPHRHRKT